MPPPSMWCCVGDEAEGTPRVAGWKVLGLVVAVRAYPVFRLSLVVKSCFWKTESFYQSRV